jgi:hypothetical protein
VCVWEGFQFGVKRLRFDAGQGAEGVEAEGVKRFPSRMYLDRNFLDDEAAAEEEEEEEEDEEDEEDEDTSCDMESHEGDEEEGEEEAEEEEPLYRGLYRAMYAFDPKGTVEMALVEDHIVRIVGRGGVVGGRLWSTIAIVSVMDLLVPESYLEPVRLVGLEE